MKTKTKPDSADALERRLTAIAEKLRQNFEAVSAGFIIRARDHIEKQGDEIARLRAALERISWVKPDRICHALDVAIIERAVRVAAAALKGDE